MLPKDYSPVKSTLSPASESSHTSHLPGANSMLPGYVAGGSADVSCECPLSLWMPSAEI